MVNIRGTKLSVKYLIDDRLKYNQDRIEHKIPYNLDIELESNQEQNLNIINFLKQTELYNVI